MFSFYFYKIMFLNKYNLFFILVLSTITIAAQDTIITNVIVFDQSNNNDTTKKDNVSLFKNAIKINPLLFLRGEIPVYYERSISNFFSIEASVGLTFKDYLGNASEEMSSNDFELEFEDYTEKVKPNLSYGVGIRYYTGGYALDGVYFALYFAKRNFDRDIIITSTTQNFDQNFNATTIIETFDFREKRHHNEIRLIYGENEFYFWDNMFLDYYIGIGIDFYNKDKVKVEDPTTDPSTLFNNAFNPFNNLNLNKTYSIESTSSIAPRFYLGVKYGFAF